MKYKIDFKELLKKANWEHKDFAIIAAFFVDWEDEIFDEKVIKTQMQIKMDEKEQKIKELFDMVYEWGRVGVVAGFESNAFRKKLKEVVTEESKAEIK